MYEYIEKGGLLMWPLLVCSVISVLVSLERVLFWHRWLRGIRAGSADQMIKLAEQGAFNEALGMAKPTDGFSRVLAAGLRHHRHGLTENMVVAADGEVALMRRGMGILDTIITLAPLLGILGTVLGIIQSFESLGAGGVQDPKGVVAGISVALITTAAGLTVAIVTLLPYNYFRGKVLTATQHLEKTATLLEVACRKGSEGNHEA